LKVSLIAYTALAWGNNAPTVHDVAPAWDRDSNVTPADKLAEFGGRACYQSWSNPSGRDNAAYLRNIIDQGHFSVLEHASATFYIEDVSRALTHELVRHRHLSYSQVSQRFVKSEDAGYVVPPALRELGELEVHEDGSTVSGMLDMVQSTSRWAYIALARALEREGLDRKKAREAARAVLPNMTATSIVVTGNHRAWRDVISKRYAPGADAEIYELAGELLRQLCDIAPAIYQDFSEGTKDG
jgi:thymidylate synthase (FAD)